MDHDFFVVDPEFKRTFDYVGELLVVMVMLGNDAPLLEEHPRQHDFLANHELPLKQRIQILQRDGVPWNVLGCWTTGGVFGDSTLGTRVRFGAGGTFRL